MKKIKPYLQGFWFSLPLQLVLLHFKRYQALLFFWVILFATVNGSFLFRFGAHTLYLAPEYLGDVNAFSAALVGISVAVFVMSWNVTTFILHSRQVRFLATTAQPFLKYCINNGVIPLFFLCVYFIKAFQFQKYQELMSTGQILLLTAGFLCGFILALAVGFSYFFGADKTIYRLMSPGMRDELRRLKERVEDINGKRERGIIRVYWYLSATLKLRQPRDVRHYSQEFIERIFKQHHIAAIISIILAFGSLLAVGYFLDNKYFQLPAAASSTVFFAVLIAVAGAVSYFLQAWTIPVLILCTIGLNTLYKKNIIDPRNKAYGLDYAKDKRAQYTQQALSDMCSADSIRKDSAQFIELLNAWKAKQTMEKPPLFVVNVSGGGSRAATFTMNVLQKLDSITSGRMMPQTLLISGASGGMMGAAWFRELYWRRSKGEFVNIQNQRWTRDISKDLLNPLFASFVSRDLISPAQYFKIGRHEYIKDRGYLFEEKLNENTGGLMNRQLKEYAAAEKAADIPLMMFNCVITRDGRKVIIGNEPARFLMKPIFDTNHISDTESDALDFASFFRNQQATDIRVLSALRMNATFPYVLPNVWLPADPVIDVMDAGFRDNTGIDFGMRMLFYFRQWVAQNCGSVVFVQVRGSSVGGWDDEYEPKNVFDLVTKPALLTQTNLFRFQEYQQQVDLQYFAASCGVPVNRILFEYIPAQKEAGASLSFHLTQREKRDILESLENKRNLAALLRVKALTPAVNK